MMKLLMGVINAKRIFLRCDVVSKHKVKLISAVSHSCNRCDSVVRLAFSFSVNECFFVGVASPSFEYLVSKVNESVYKRNKDGKAAFERFIDYVNNK